MKQQVIRFETDNGNVRLTIKKIIFFLLVLNLLLAGFIVGFALGGRIVQSNWEKYMECYESRCPCKDDGETITYAPSINASLFNL